MKHIKIVLAEDEPTIAAAYLKGLGFHGFDVVLAKNGTEALAAVSTELPDVLLLDIIMPHMNGIEVLEALRASPEHVDLPVIMLTNLGQPEDAERVGELGALAYLIKSNLSLKELVEHVRKAAGLPPV